MTGYRPGPTCSPSASRAAPNTAARDLRGAGIGLGGHERPLVPFGAARRAAVGRLVRGQDQHGAGDGSDQAAPRAQGRQPARGNRPDAEHGGDPVVVPRRRAGHVRVRHPWVQADTGQPLARRLGQIGVGLDRGDLPVADPLAQHRSAVAGPGADLQHVSVVGEPGVPQHAHHQPRRDGRGCGHPGRLVVRRGVVGVQQPDAGDQCPVGVGGADPGLGLGGAVAQLPGAGAEARPRPGPFPPAGHEQVPRHSADRRTPA